MNILDTSVLLAFIKQEKGADVVKKVFEDAEKEKNSLFIHQINFIEFVYKCYQFYGVEKTHRIVADLQSPLLGIVNYMDTSLALFCSHLKAQYHLSLADGIGLAYAKIMDGTFWTADKALQGISTKENIKISLIR